MFSDFEEAGALPAPMYARASDDASLALRLLAGAGVALVAALALSCFSGFVQPPVPFELKWGFSPLGLLLNFNREMLSWETAPTFTGPFGYHLDYFSVFLKTCALEAPFYFFLLRRQGAAFSLGALVLANFATHPVIYFVFPAVFRGFLAMGLSAELFAPSVETVLVGALCSWRAGGPGWLAVALAMFAANLFSWQMGAFV